MMGGQAIDLASEDKTISQQTLITLASLKTGALLACSTECGAHLGGASDTDRMAWISYATNLGLAFQILDDILDVTADSDILGKPQGSDLAANKSTFVSHLGLDGAKREAEIYTEKALASLKTLETPPSDAFKQVASHLLQRQY